MFIPLLKLNSVTLHFVYFILEIETIELVVYFRLLKHLLWNTVKCSSTQVTLDAKTYKFSTYLAIARYS